MLVIGGEILVLSMIAILEQTFRSNLHRADAYRAVAVVAPLDDGRRSRASRDQRWAATIIATFYTAFMATMVWLFPLFPAEPKLGPVYQPITHFIPLEFPLLLLVPAIAIDLVRARLAAWPRWRLAPVLGAVFVATFVAAEWPFATFMQSPRRAQRGVRRRLLRVLHAARVGDPAPRVLPRARARAAGSSKRSAIAIVTAWLGLRARRCDAGGAAMKRALVICCSWSLRWRHRARARRQPRRVLRRRRRSVPAVRHGARCRR